jgi:hypothetical protein
VELCSVVSDSCIYCLINTLLVLKGGIHGVRTYKRWRGVGAEAYVRWGDEGDTSMYMLNDAGLNIVQQMLPMEKKTVSID